MSWEVQCKTPQKIHWDIGTWVSGCFAEKTVEKERKKGKQIIYHRRQVSWHQVSGRTINFIYIYDIFSLISCNLFEQTLQKTSCYKKENQIIYRQPVFLLVELCGLEPPFFSVSFCYFFIGHFYIRHFFIGPFFIGHFHWAFFLLAASVFAWALWAWSLKHP